MKCRFQLLLFVLLLSANSSKAQKLTLSDLFRYRSAPLESVNAELVGRHWANSRSSHYIVPSAGKTFGKYNEQLDFYEVRKNAAVHSVEYYTSNVTYFNTVIRDSLESYGFIPDLDANEQSDVLVTKRRWKNATDTTDGRRILIKYRDTFRGKSAVIELFENGR